MNAPRVNQRLNNPVLGGVFCPRVGRNGASARLASFLVLKAPPSGRMLHAVLERAGAFVSDRAGSGCFSLAEGLNGGDASALVVAAMICSWSAMIRSNAPRAQA